MILNFNCGSRISNDENILYKQNFEIIAIVMWPNT